MLHHLRYKHGDRVHVQGMPGTRSKHDLTLNQGTKHHLAGGKRHLGRTKNVLSKHLLDSLGTVQPMFDFSCWVRHVIQEDP